MLTPIKHAWFRFALALARANAFILLTLVFFLVVLPVGLLFRLFGKSVIRPSSADSLWTPRPPETSPEKPF